MRERPDLKTLWSTQPAEGFSMPLEDIRARSAKFQRTIRLRNLREYAASLLVVLGFGLYVVILPGLVTKIGSALVIAGALFMSWQLHRRGSAQTPPPGDSVLDHLAFHRRELVRQRDALKSVAVWYLAPFAPGMAVFLAGMWLYNPATLIAVAATGLSCLVVFGLIWLLNRWGASRLQKLIDALDYTA